MPQYSNDIAITFPGGSPLVGLANNGRAVSNPIDNSINQFNVIDIELTIKFGATGVVAGGSVVIAIFGSDDGGVTYENTINPNNTLETITNNVSNGISITARIQLTNVPQFLKLVVRNVTGAAFNATSGNFASFYCGLTDDTQAVLVSDQITVTPSVTLLAAANLAREGIVIINTGSVPIYLGPISVTTLTGFPLDANATLDLKEFSGNALYGIVPSSTAVAGVLQW